MGCDFKRLEVKTSSDVGILTPAYIAEGIIEDGIAAGEAVVAGNVVYLDGTANEWMLADADAAGEFPAWGIVLGAGADGDEVPVLMLGMLTVDGASYTEGGLVYLSAATPGAFTQSAPGGGNDQILGVALTTEKIWVNPHSIKA